MEEYKQALEGVSSRELVEILDEADVGELRRFLDEGTSQAVEVGDVCLNNDTIYKMADGRYLLVVWRFASAWSNRPEFAVFDKAEDAVEYYKSHEVERAKAWGQASLDEWKEAEGLTEDEGLEADALEEWEELVYNCFAC